MKLHKLMQALQQIHKSNDTPLEAAMNADGNLVLYNVYTTYVIDLDLEKVTVSDTSSVPAKQKQSLADSLYGSYESLWDTPKGGLPSTSTCQADVSISSNGLYTVSCLGHAHFKSQEGASTVKHAWEKHLESIKAPLKDWGEIKYTYQNSLPPLTPAKLTEQLKKYNLPGVLGCQIETSHDPASATYVLTCKAHKDWKAAAPYGSMLTKLWNSHVSDVAGGKYYKPSPAPICQSKITPPKGNVAKGWWKVECLMHDWQVDAIPNAAVEKYWQSHLKEVAKGKWKSPKVSEPENNSSW